MKHLTDREALECVSPDADCVAFGCQKRSPPVRRPRWDTIIGFIVVCASWATMCGGAFALGHYASVFFGLALAWSTMAVGAWIRRDLGNPWGDR